MNQKLISTKDPFRAAYLLRFGTFKESKMENNEKIYVLEGENLFEEDFRYRTGYALVNPLLLKEAFELFSVASGCLFVSGDFFFIGKKETKHSANVVDAQRYAISFSCGF